MWLLGYNNGKPVEMTQEVSMAFCIDKKNSESIVEMFSEKAANYFSSGTVALFEKKNPKKALKSYNYGINYLPYNQNLLLMRGICRYELGDKAGAYHDWNRISNMDGIDLSEYSALVEEMKGYDELIALLKK
jgi:tetratricopeptide (TPR) repeat protein